MMGPLVSAACTIYGAGAIAALVGDTVTKSHSQDTVTKSLSQDTLTKSHSQHRHKKSHSQHSHKNPLTRHSHKQWSETQMTPQKSGFYEEIRACQKHNLLYR